MIRRFTQLFVMFGLCTTTIQKCIPSKYMCKNYEARLAYVKEEKGVLREMLCSCDTLCKFFNDCCPDALSNKIALPAGFSQLSPNLVACQRFPEVTAVNFVYFVNRCPSTWRDGVVKEACETELSDNGDFVLRVPVTGHTTGLLYKNLYCAMCHGSSYIFWRPVVKCNRDNVVLTDNTTMHDVYLKSGCHLKFDKPAPYIDYRHCLTPYRILDTCPEGYEDNIVKEKCENTEGFNLVFDKNNITRAFHNRYCAICLNDGHYSCNAYYGFPTVDPYAFYPFIMAADLNSVSLTATFGSKYARHTLNMTDISSCPSDHVFDPFTVSCVKIDCDEWLVLRDGVCQTNISDLPCRQVELLQHEYTILDNGDLLEISSGIRYAKSSYYLRLSSAFVCSNASVTYTTPVPTETQIEFKFSPVEVHITIAGLLVSLVALFATVLTYAAISSLQNTSGKCIMSLSISLFIADLLMLIGPNVEDIAAACKGIAICMHYSFLASFFWMNTVAVDALVTVFDIAKHRAAEKLTKRFPFYSIVSWVGPALIVASSVLVDTFMVDPTFKPNYGLGICWLTNKNALMVFFAGPLFFIIFVNAILFGIIASKLGQIRDRSRHAEESNALVCIKLFVVIGLTWTLGFVANVIPHPVFWYLFIFLNTLQGLFIFLAFVTTKRVWRMVRDRFPPHSGEPESGLAVLASSLAESVSHTLKSSEAATGKGNNISHSSNQM